MARKGESDREIEERERETARERGKMQESLSKGREGELDKEKT
jgi:hypothetical protein